MRYNVTQTTTEQKKSDITLTEEQLDSIAAGFLPAMREFFNSESGKKLYAEHQNKAPTSENKGAA